MATETFSAVSSPIQYAAVVAFQGRPAIDDYLAQIRRILKPLMNYAWKRLHQQGARLCEPRGGFYLFPVLDNLRERLAVDDSATLCAKLLDDTGVAVLPGRAFGRPGTELSMRIACVDFDGSRALNQAAALPLTDNLNGDFLRQNCAPTMEGIDRLCDWLASS